MARSPRTAGKLLRAVFFALILAVNLIIIWRIFTSGDPKAIRTLAPNETLVEAYRSSDGKLSAFRQEQATVTRAANNAGYFAVTECVFLPEAHQVQIVFRYNNSTLRHLAEDKGLDATPPKSGTYFDVTLLRTTDTTPDNPDDNTDPATRQETRYHATGDPVRVHTSLYTYFRYTFDNIDIEDDTIGVFADIFYLGDLDYSATPYGTLCLWDNGSKNLPYKLTKADRKALESAASSAN